MYWHSGKRLVLLLLLVVGLGSCSGRQETPESRIRAWLAAGEVAAEARSLPTLKAMISPAYHDRAGQDRRALVRMLAGYLLRHRSLHILTRVVSIDWHPPDRAKVVIFAAMAANPIQASATLLSVRADIYRIDLELNDLEGEWRLVTAAWRQAQAADLHVALGRVTP